MMPTKAVAVAAAVAVGYFASEVQAHGYMYIPLTEFDGAANGAWIVQIEPQFKADWESVNGDTELIALYVEKAKEAGYANNIRKLLDGDTSLYGADCGFSNPNASPKDPPTDGTATFERGIAHHGPCEIWLDDTMVLHDDDCALTYGTSDYATIKSVIKPVDYSSCSTSGCMFRFYWLAFQGSESGKYVWQIYKDCIPLSGPAGGQSSSTTQVSNSTASTTAPATTTQSSGAGDTAASSNAPASTDAPAVTNTPATNAPASTDAPTPNEQSTESTQTPTWAPTTQNSPATNAPANAGQAAWTQSLTWTNAPIATNQPMGAAQAPMTDVPAGTVQPYQW
ncbi:hypothetical protein PHYBOEH_003120 [Phytophthora boehmeriae]|uniref:Uncharacterized protein n=1 Tax=Phytophthora boehmeriae TaxID=109152 RepID=A0A8T1WPJ3_9STRA|nr:hypothetical protein PHYBOEH_003120 [Phytophthora boehmeriae]